MLFSMKSSIVAVFVLLVFVAHIGSGDAKTHIRRHKSKSPDNGDDNNGKHSKGDKHASGGKQSPEQGGPPSSKGGKGVSPVPVQGGGIPTIQPSACSKYMPKITKVVNLAATMTISGNFDCGNALYKNTHGPVFLIQTGATISNCFFSQTGTLDTVDIVGKGTTYFKNIFFLSVGDDGISLKGSVNVEFDGGVCMNAWNKCFQHDGTGYLHIKNLCAEKAHIVAKSCGNCRQNADLAKVKRTITLDNITLGQNVKTLCAVNANTQDTCTITHVTGKPVESLCTEYDAIHNPNALPFQESKNKQDSHCIIHQ